MNKGKTLVLFKSPEHQHQKCLHAALASAKRHCDVAGLRLTPIRLRVLELIWQSHEPVKAYDILNELKQQHASSAPPTVYRALDFLLREGLVHKIESLNAYTGCANTTKEHWGQFFICHSCGLVAELNDDDIRNLIEKKARQFGFTIDDEMVEIEGCCQECSQLKGLSR